VRKHGQKGIRGAAQYGKGLLAAGAILAVLTGCGEGNDGNMGNGQQPSAAPSNIAATTEQASAIKPEELGEAMLRGEYGRIYGQLSDSFKEQVSEADLTKMMKQFTEGVSAFEPISALKVNGSEQRVWRDGSGERGVFGVFDGEGTIHGLQLLGLSSFPETDNARTETVFDLPFEGEWLVYWGGSNVLLNYHYEHESQRYAYDFVQAKDGYTYNGDPANNESYYAFGKPVLAPAEGIVVAVINDIDDNAPVGVMNEKEPAGNLVVIDHGGNEYSFLAHLKKGSVTKKPGDKVKRGEEIGLLGNSGNSSEPHLHYQVSDGADLFSSRSIHVNWNAGLAPVRGDIVNKGE